ncbi:Crp/Fnr family transcriptional regulator [Embleya hyalina]|uniref:Crp/Fnr family transcriptional regulator n=1 Tax=Embleya hyalina TaxID=516124 RepID=A0A401YYP7_9ACTN|nr:helix-turn-helix domain-containing protein [Embleya hyalina]GCD99670.1 Crp/Fnr family transcriptional regulator [Embleya hyalina]
MPRPRRTPEPDEPPAVPSPRYARRSYPAHSFLGLLDIAHREALLRRASVSRVNKSGARNLYYEKSVFVVLSGILREIPYSGDSTNTRLRMTGDIVESSTVFDPLGGNAMVHGVQSTAVIAIPRPVFTTFLATRPAAMTALAKSMAQREKLDLYLDVHVRHGTTPVRIARYLCFLADFLGEETGTAVHPGIRISGFSQSDIAEGIGASRASVENFFREQRTAGRVTTAYRVIDIVDPASLRAGVGNMPPWQP